MRNMGKGRTWTKEEINYLRDKYGYLNLRDSEGNLRQKIRIIRK